MRMLETPETHVVSRKIHGIPAESPDRNAPEFKGTRPSQMWLYGSLTNRKNRKHPHGNLHGDDRALGSFRN